MTNTRKALYKRWKSMISRCYDTDNAGYVNYGGRGITVCDRWLFSFDNFFEDLNATFKIGLSIDRIDNNNGYFLENVRWATPKQQCNNRRNNLILNYNNESLTLQQWADKIGIPSDTLNLRIKSGLPLKEALSPILKRRGSLRFNAKLNEAQVIEIYTSKFKIRELAKTYNVDMAVISGIKRGMTWKHVTVNLQRGGKKHLSDNQVIEISNSTEPLRLPAKRYNCSMAAISLIRNGKSFKHLTSI